jgi:17beta-estradiol 17-dehydrogenase / very-long-chain 3-oxoacyl-CoA reductase
MTEDEYREMLEVNNNAMVAMTHLVVPGMVSRRRGAVVNLSSIAGTNPMPLISLYGSTKAFVTSFSTNLSFEHASQGVSFQSVTPGYVHTPMTRDVVGRYTGIWKLFYPDACGYAKSAVATIPFARDTTGYWSHALQFYFFSFLGPSMWGRIILRRNLKLHDDFKNAL